MDIILNGVKLSQYKYNTEEEFEADIIQSAKSLFGEKSVYINCKKKISGSSLGNTIPDGFLLNFSDDSDPEFYIVEVELAKHDFYRHIFPQVTKFFSFFNNNKNKSDLIEKIYTIIEDDAGIKNDVKKLCKGKEIYKLLKDSIDENQNILLILDENKPELSEIFNTYGEWSSKVKLEIIKKFKNGTNTVYSMDPEFDELEFYVNDDIRNEETTSENEDGHEENVHLNKAKGEIKEIYIKLKGKLLTLNPALIFNPQRYYISIRTGKNIVFVKIRQKKIRLIIMLDPAIIREKIVKNNVKDLSQAVQNFYNGPCAAVDIDNIDNLDEVVDLLGLLV